MTRTPTEEADRPGSPVAIHSLLRRTIEFSSLALIVGFVLSLMINSAVFTRWKIEYLAFASTSDVLMDGMYFLFDLGYAALFMGAAWFFPRLPFIGFTESENLSSLPLAGLLAAFFLPLFIIGREAGISFLNYYEDAVFYVHNYSSVCVLGTIGTVVAILGLQNPTEREVLGGTWVFRTSVLVFPIMAIVGAIGVVNFRQDVGYFETYLRADVAPGECSQPAQIIWSGTDYSAARCGPEAKVRVLRSETIDVFAPLNHQTVKCDLDWLKVLRRCRYVSKPI